MNYGGDWMARLQQDYLSRLPQKLARLEELITALSTGTGDGEAMEALVMAVHQLRGSAGTYGLSQTGRIAAEWEDAVRHFQRSPGPLSAEDLERLASFLEEVRESIPTGEPAGLQVPATPLPGPG